MPQKPDKTIEQPSSRSLRWKKTGPPTRVGRVSSEATLLLMLWKLRGSNPVSYSLAERGAEKLWNLVNTEDYVNCLGALTGGQAMQQVKAGVKAIYLSGWQVAADNNTYSSMYPDQSLYPVDSVPKVVETINNTFRRADEIQ